MNETNAMNTSFKYFIFGLHGRYFIFYLSDSVYVNH